MRIHRHFTAEDRSPYDGIAFRTAASEIRNPDGSVVFAQGDIEVPESWSQVACDVLAQKYFRKAGVPARLKKVEENDVPSFLWRSVADEAALSALPAAERYGFPAGFRHLSVRGDGQTQVGQRRQAEFHNTTGMRNETLPRPGVLCEYMMDAMKAGAIQHAVISTWRTHKEQGFDSGRLKK